MITAATFVGSLVFRINLIWPVLLSGLLGVALFWRLNQLALVGSDDGQLQYRPSGGSKSFSRFAPLIAAGALIAVTLAVPATRTLFVAFFQVGLLAFGGGFASVALLQHVVVDQMHWLTFTQFRDGIALGQVTPGPVLITAGFVGYNVSGVLGSLAATFWIFLPPAILIVMVADLHDRFKRNRIVQAVGRRLSMRLHRRCRSHHDPVRSQFSDQLANLADLRCQLRAGVVVQTKRRLGDPRRRRVRPGVHPGVKRLEITAGLRRLKGREGKCGSPADVRPPQRRLSCWQDSAWC